MRLLIAVLLIIPVLAYAQPAQEPMSVEQRLALQNANLTLQLAQIQHAFDMQAQQIAKLQAELEKLKKEVAPK